MLTRGVVGVSLSVELRRERSPRGRYWGMYCGPFGASRFVNGFVANQARNAVS
jgi:hypothetical protein